MHIDIVAIGNSQGIRLPKAILAQCGFDQKVALTVEDKKIILSRATVEENGPARSGWAEAFRAMNADAKTDESWPHISNMWDEEEWEW